MVFHPELLDFFREQNEVQLLLKEGREQSREEGIEQGIEQGQMLGRERILLALLRIRFGKNPDTEAVARRLVDWDEEAAVAAINAAPDLASLQRH